MTTTRSARPCVSVPAPLLAAYRDACDAAPADAPLPPLSTLLRDAMAAELAARGIHVPEAPPSSRTAAATRARWLCAAPVVADGGHPCRLPERPRAALP